MSLVNNVALSVHELENAFEVACADFYERTSRAQGLCGQSYRQQETEEQKSAVVEMDVADARCGVIKDAISTSNLEPYKEMLARDRQEAQAKVVADGQVMSPAASREVKPATFEQVYAVVELSRRLSIQDYYRHLAAVVDAAGEAEKQSAVARLFEAEKAARLADSAFQSLMTAQAAQRTATVSIVRGDFETAQESFTASGHHMDIVANKLDHFGAYVPKSRFFQSTMSAVAKADVLAGRIESAVEHKVETFASGLRGFAMRVRVLSVAVRRVPAVVRHMTQSAKVSAAQAATTACTSLSERIGTLVKRVGDRVDSAKKSVKGTAWDLVDDGADLLVNATDRFIGGAERVADKLDLHVRATAGLAGGLFACVGGAMKEAYGDSFDQVQAQRAARRAAPR